MSILIVEDELRVRAFLTRGLSEEGLQVVDCAEGAGARELLRQERFELILLDWMLPGVSGMELLQELRARRDVTPVIMLTARDAVVDRVAALNAGADDYLIKPFAFEELLARVRALLRRVASRPTARLSYADLVLDPITRRVIRAGVDISLTAREFSLLQFLLEHAGDVVSRTRIIQAVWDHDFETFSNVVEVYIRYLRTKVDEPFGSRLIHTVRGVGYVLRSGGVKRPLSLRNRLALVFAAGVLGTLVLQSALVTGVLIIDEWWDQQIHPPGSPPESLLEDVWPVLGAIALTAPFVVFGALSVGRSLAHRALAPMREASQRAREARASTLDLSLPLRGTGDEWDELATTLNGLLSEGRSTLERIRRFTSDAAHELRTPLTVLMGETEVVLRRERSASEYRQALEVVAEESRGLASLVDALLTLSRADSGTLVGTWESVDLLPLAQGALRRAERLREVRARTVRLELSGASVLVRGDALLLARVLDNLLSNALRHGLQGVRVEVEAVEGSARVRVVDDGPGVTPAFEPQLFQRFAQADVARGGEGVGLGLALSRAIAEAHGGSLGYTRTGAGESQFMLQLPALPE